NTVKFHMKNLFAKLNVHNRNEATVFFLTSGYQEGYTKLIK
ncbi:MAG: response regulator transcription factor, partial [Flavobacteriaceae bacterium]|nr:response regulator transcription factor [Flavobacteriaceae bacterium]